MSGTVPNNNQHCGARAGARDGRGGLCQVPYPLIINTVVRELELEMVEEDYVRYRTVPTNYQHCGVRAGARDG